MCGFAGVVNLSGLAETGLEPRLSRAVERLRPRGPDGNGRWRDGRCALAHTRLAVIDLSDAAAQPMSRHGRVIAYNGEIYNFANLSEKLRRRGYNFSSNSDTEVLLAGWACWGAGLLDRLTGMFAFALWDAHAGELVLARDRFGKKPLLYCQNGRRVSFASDMDALLALEDSPGDLDPNALGLLFSLRYIPDPYAIFSRVRKLPPGTLARFNDDGLRLQRWYHPTKMQPPRYTSEIEAQHELRQRLDAATRERLVADVPVGLCLSGGIDSAIIAASLVAQGHHVRSFTIGVRGASAYYEERPEAREVARYLHLNHTEVEIDSTDAGKALSAVIEGFDEPFADSSGIPTYLLSREMRKHVTVALSGDGADEVFGGYRKYQGELQAERYRRLPIILRRHVLEPAIAALPESKDYPWLERARRLRRFCAHAGKEATDRQAGWMRELSLGEIQTFLIAPQDDNYDTPEKLVAALHEEAMDDDPINRMLFADLRIVLAGDILVKVDRMSMANGLEIRCPMLDQRVVECAAAMPGAFKLVAGSGKRILRQAFADRLPNDVFRRPKKGFEVPIAHWLTNDLADMTRAAIDPGRLRAQGLLNPELPKRWYGDLMAGKRDTAGALWTVVAFQGWAERHGMMRLSA